jgi:phage terminase large subunit-like protein
MEEPDWLHAVAEDETYEWARLAWRRAAAVEGAWFDHKLAEGVVREWPTWATLTEDRFAGLPFHLLPWQEIVVRLLVGWMVPVEVLDPISHRPQVEHVRLFRRLLLWVPRKNGKSEFLAALALLFFVLDRTISPQGFLFARTQDQAKLVFRKMKDMIANSAELAEAVVPYKRSLWFKELRGAFELLTGSEEGKHGKSPTVIVGDEMHEWRSLELPNTLRQGHGAPGSQPDRTLRLHRGAQDQRHRRAALGREPRHPRRAGSDDPTTLVVIFAANDNDDWQDEQAWRRANPSLGLSPTLAFLRREARIAVDNPRQLAHFVRYHLNRWVDSWCGGSNIKQWDACAA